MRSVLVTDVPALVSVAHVERAIRLPAEPGASVAEARRIGRLLAQAIEEGHDLERYADPEGPGLPIDLASATADQLAGAFVGVRLRSRPPVV